MQEIIDIFIKFRKHICPKTSYLTGGSAASTVLVLDLTSSSNHHLKDTFLTQIIERKEFEHYKVFTAFEEILSIIDQHVIAVISNEVIEVAIQEKLLELLKVKKTKLLFHLNLQLNSLTSPQNNVTHHSVFRWNEFEEIYHASKTFDENEVKVWYFHKLYKIPLNKRPPPESYLSVPLGFNKQPAVSCRLHFRFLWNLFPKHLASALPFQDTEQNLRENKLRVLQRLSEHAVFNPKNDGEEKKLSMEEWDHLITKALVNHGDDWDIYSLIREKTFGTSLEADTDPLTILIPNYYNHSSKSTGLQAAKNDIVVDTQNSEERADYLVDRIFDSLPEAIQKRPTEYVKSLLDYGCAEGGITSEIGKRLQLPPDKTFGADVRSISSHTFRFLPLASENRSNPLPVGEILPSLGESSISLINASMVFHHVMHIDHVILELRRVLNWESGLLLIREHDCLSSGSGAFLDIVHGLYSLAWQNPVEWPDFILEYEAYYRSREKWTLLLNQYGFELKVQQPNLYDSAIRSKWNAKKNRFSNVARAYYALYIPKRNSSNSTFDMKFYLNPKNNSLIPNSNNIKPITNIGVGGGVITKVESTEQIILRSFSRDENGALLTSPRAASKRQRSIDEEDDAEKGIGRTRKQSEGADETQVIKRPKMDVEGNGQKTPSFDDFDIYESQKYPGCYYRFYKYQDRSVWIDN